MNIGLTGKVAIVTGGGSGVGEAIVRQFAENGCNVVLNYIVDESHVLDLTEQLNLEYKAKIVPVKADLAKQKDTNNLFQQALDEFGCVDILVNCAGIWLTHYLREMDRGAWDKTMAINLAGPMELCKSLCNHLIDTRRVGKIVNVVSQAAFHGSTSGHSHYAASKAGLVALTVSLAREMGPYGINVNAIAPGIVRTPMLAGQKFDDYLSRIPLGRVAEPDDLANGILFLVSKQADYITGATLDVTGGMLMR